MNTFNQYLFAVAFAISATIAPAVAAGKLDVSDAWIRAAPPNAMMLAGYATLHNAGDAPITINAVSAAGFDDTSMHETVLVGDVSKMRPLATLTIAPGASVTFAPGGKHIMLMQPTTSPAPGNRVVITFNFADGGQRSADFLIRDAAPGATDAMPATHQH